MPPAPKKTIDDIVSPVRPAAPRNRLPRRDITIALSAKKKTDDAPPNAPPPSGGSIRPPSAPSSPPSKNTLIFGGGALLLALLLGGAAMVFGSVTVEVTPREQTGSHSGTFTAYPDATAAPQGESVLVYSSTPVSRDAEEKVPATERKKVEERAVGTIVIFNDFSNAEQRLVTNTRFETPDGRTFRINKPVVIPGQRTEGGKTVPGSVEAAVFADEPGEAYNIGLTDFTIPGFKGSPRFEKFYARSKTPMAGGFSGERLVPDAAAVKAAEERLRTQLLSELESSMKVEAPPQSIFLGAGSTTFEVLPQKEAADGVIVGLKATAPAYFIDESAFAGALAKQAFPDYDGFSVSFKEPHTFSISVEPGEMEEGSAQTINITVSGEVGVEWFFDAEALAHDLAGKRSVEMEEIMHEKHPGIETANAVFRPFCIGCAFPNDPTEIEIVTADDPPPALGAE